MSYPRFVIGIALSTTLIAGGLLLVSASSSQACFGIAESGLSSLSQNSNPASQNSNRKGFLGWTPWHGAAAASIVSLVGLVSAGMIYKNRLKQGKAIATSAPLHPELEHPELLLTTLSKEAFSDGMPQVEAVKSKREVVLTR